ncbi:hypothetical protein MTQ01_00470 [Streptomyces sp. XM4193]|uniref:hypothetical protein n=1 Tax=Streptomyces sp. XM4193 TaxID=2929782 RepID=UPI001FF9D053|nr:hypothetical protein [Streptomyces sp. XM4193]MCK1794526.1 hypothetical protein [Streptomyces sp. XM4193]
MTSATGPAGRAGTSPVSLVWGVAVWSAIVGAAVLLALRPEAPAPRADVLACLAVAVLGVLAHHRQTASEHRAALRLPPAPITARPPRAVRLLDRRALADSRFATAAVVASAAVPLLAVGEWALSRADASHTADPVSALTRGAGLAALILLWSWGVRRVTAAESEYVADAVEDAVASGTARFVPVQVTGWSAGVHRPHPEGALPVAGTAARKGRPYGERAARARTARRQFALRLSVPGAGERLLHLDHRVHAEALASAFHGRPGRLHWVPSGRPGDASASVPAVLALGDGRCALGWTPDAPGPGAPDGPEIGTVHRSEEVQELRPAGTATLRRRPAFLAGTVLHTAALLLCGSVLLGFWEGTAEGALAALLIAPALSASALLLRSALHTRELLRLGRDRPGAGPAVPAPPPPAPPAGR